MELTTRLARVLQNKSLMASLGPMQGYLGGDEASVSRADGGADNDRGTHPGAVNWQTVWLYTASAVKNVYKAHCQLNTPSHGM